MSLSSLTAVWSGEPRALQGSGWCLRRNTRAELVYPVSHVENAGGHVPLGGRLAAVGSAVRLYEPVGDVVAGQAQAHGESACLEGYAREGGVIALGGPLQWNFPGSRP